VLVGVAGFEPATPSSRTRCATRLRYTPPQGRSYNCTDGAPQAPETQHRKRNDRAALPRAAIQRVEIAKGSKIVKIEWLSKKNPVSPYFVMVPDTLKSVSFIEKNSKRFPDTHGWHTPSLIMIQRPTRLSRP
jgi:hypothetical protein